VATDPKSGAPRPFDVTTIEHLIGLMAQHDLTEIALQEGEQKIRLRKGGDAPAFPPGGYVPAPPTAYAPGPQAPGSPTPGANAPGSQTLSPQLHEIKSEMVGTFYSKPKPDKDDYVKVGSKVKPDTIVCQIEAMKIFNEVHAGLAGTVAKVCVNNGEFVEHGTVLFLVDPS
jgi:acetyl-CoA carboxylase biotin carboxyl carrier protein